MKLNWLYIDIRLLSKQKRSVYYRSNTQSVKKLYTQLLTAARWCAAE